MNEGKVRLLRARLDALAKALFVTVGNPPLSFATDFDKIVAGLAEEIDPEITEFSLPADAIFGTGQDGIVYRPEIISKVEQLKLYLEALKPADAVLITAGGLYTSIKDDELRRRVSDLIAARDMFDRAISQATLVLEDRIRKKSGTSRSLIGVAVVNQLINAEPSKAVLKISDVPSEQEGFAYICRGIMLAFRNETHHTISDKFGREEALKTCVFIDNLLSVVDSAKVQSENDQPTKK